MVIWKPQEMHGNSNGKAEPTSGKEEVGQTGRKFDGTFIQAKDCEFRNAQEHIRAARHQLEGNCASGNGAPKDRERSLIGPGHTGIIQVRLWNGGDMRIVENAAREALTSPYVKLVQVHDLNSNEVYKYT
ncbi:MULTISPECIES: hypothetical protein [Amycolatopsis]|uniref:Uncharacterized protein n=1 Tax=Amycolatopsis bullii TaxID=941987 RepID=A0ABQ3KF77_9PSEU|nr:hypothetical protein [Amycolatopsis bullii]GHG21150.1 hypothetical protein GCM10017567_44720 [Amycolatopsis bullii]